MTLGEPIEAVSRSMLFGAAAVLDILGFKELRRKRAADVINAVKAARAAAKSATWMRNFHSADRFHVSAFSDTIILAAETGDREKAPETYSKGESHMVSGIVMAVGSVCSSAAAAELPMMLRGCVTCGGLVVDDEIYVGDAIDHAAEFYEAANAAVVWLTPKASEKLTPEYRIAVLDWDVPLKTGGSLSTLVVNPFCGAVLENLTEETLEQFLVRIDRLRVSMLESFNSERIDVVQKMQNTKKLLDAAREHVCKHYESERDAYYEALADAQEKPGGEG